MGVLSRIYEVTALTGGVYGATHQLPAVVNDGINKLTNNGLEDLLRGTTPVMHAAGDVLPYALALYLIIEGGSKLVNDWANAPRVAKAPRPAPSAEH